MNCLLLICICKLSLIAFSAGQEVKAIVDKYELLSYNEKILATPHVQFFQYNETNQALNISGQVLADLGMKLTMTAEVFEVQNGVPHLLTTAKDINVCDMMTMGIPEIEELFKFGNFSQCPMTKGYYGASNLVLDMNKIPPTAPRGTYIIEVRTYNDTTELGHSKTYMRVEDGPGKKE